MPHQSKKVDQVLQQARFIAEVTAEARKQRKDTVAEDGVVVPLAARWDKNNADLMYLLGRMCVALLNHSLDHSLKESPIIMFFAITKINEADGSFATRYR